MWLYNRTIARSVEISGPKFLSKGIGRIVLYPLPMKNGPAEGAVWLTWAAADHLDPAKLGPNNVRSRLRRTEVFHPYKQSLRLQITEHLFAALALLGVNSVLISVQEGDEVPLLDGSIKAYMDLINAVGVVDLPTQRRVLQVTEPFEYRNGRQVLRLLPVQQGAQELKLSCLIDFRKKLGGWRSVGRQQHSGTLENWQRVASAKSFGLLWQGNLLHRFGLLHRDPAETAWQYRWSGDLSVPVSAQKGRFMKEEVYHKGLDCLGDLYAVFGGNLPLADIEVQHGGHKLHLAAAQTFKAEHLQRKWGPQNLIGPVFGA